MRIYGGTGCVKLYEGGGCNYENIWGHRVYENIWGHRVYENIWGHRVYENIWRHNMYENWINTVYFKIVDHYFLVILVIFLLRPLLSLYATSVGRLWHTISIT